MAKFYSATCDINSCTKGMNIPATNERANCKEDDALSPLPSEGGDLSPVSGSPRNNTFNVFMGHSRRIGLQGYDGGQANGIAGLNARTFKMPKDALQPKEGSLRSIRDAPQPRKHSQCEAPSLDEETDSFSDIIRPMRRDRAHTCPETLRQRRHLKCKLLNRPPTPPPSDIEPSRTSREVVSTSSHKSMLRNQQSVD